MMPFSFRPNRFLIAGLVLILIANACGGPAPAPTALRPAVTATADHPQPTPTVSGLPVETSGGLRPRVIEQRPAMEEEAAIDASFEIVFNQAMDPQRTGASWQVSGPDGEPLAGLVSWPEVELGSETRPVSGRVLRFTPGRPLLPGARYTARLSAGATSRTGVTLEEDATFTFQVVGDLAVTQVSPPPGSLEVSGETLITVVFNHPVVPLLVVEEQGQLAQPLEIEPAVAGVGEWLNTSVYVFRPAKPLPGGSLYRATVKAGLVDVLGGRLAQDYTWKFSTIAPSVEALNLPNLYWQPVEGLADIPLDQPFQLLFRQPMQRASVEAAFSVTSQDGAKASFQQAWNELSTQVVFTPTQLLRLGTAYTLRLDPAALSADGGSLREGVAWHFTTVQPPALTGFSVGDGETLKSYMDSFTIFFSSPMQYSSLEGKVSIIPQPEGGFKSYYWEKQLVFYGLEPSTRYEVRIQPGMQDRYGNRIETGAVVRFTNGPYLPSAHLLMPIAPALFRAGGEHVFYLSSTNVSAAEFSLYRLSLKEFADLTSYVEPLGKFQPAKLVRSWVETGVGPWNQHSRRRISLAEGQEGHLPPGIYFLGLDSREIEHLDRWLDARILIVASANLTMKTTPGEALIWLTDLENGAPLPDVQVKIYDDKLNETGQGITDADGLALLESQEKGRMVKFAVAGEIDGSQAFQPFAIANRDWENDLGLYDLGIITDYYTVPGQPTAYLYTDRPIYRPGQTVYYKGVVRVNDDLQYHLPDASRVWVTVTSYDESVYSQTLTLTEMGTFAGEFKLDGEAALGGYSISVAYPSGQPFGGVGFTVAEYHKPEFQVGVRAAPADVLAGESISATVDARFYSGGSVSGAEVNWTLTAQRYLFNPSTARPEWSLYSFNDYDRDVYFYHTPNFFTTQVIAQGQGVTDANGRLHMDLPAPAGELGESQSLILEATVTDLTGNPVSARAQVVAHRSAVYPGIRTRSSVSQIGEEQALELAAVDWAGNPIPGQGLQVEVVERRWHSVQEEDNEGRLVWKTTVEEIPVASFDEVRTGESGEAMVRFVPPNGGVYRARVSALDSVGNEASASTYLWVAGEDYVPWRQSGNHTFELVADRESYRPGDTAEILVASPFEGPRYALVTVERGHVIERQVIRLESNSTLYRLPITAQMAPNVYVSVVVIQGASDNGLADFKIGMINIQVSREQQELQVEVTPDRIEASPGEAVTYTVRTLDSAGQPVSAEVSLALVDLSVLSLLGPNTIPMLDYFYSRRSLGVLTAVPLTLSIEEFNAELAERATQLPMGSGGGKGGEAPGVFEVRQDFPDTAYWTAHLLTDDAGEVQVVIRLPDNLTTWRMEARAVTLDTRSGQAVSDLLSTKALLVRPQTPRFFVAGDRTWLSAAVHNNTVSDLVVEASLDAQGVALDEDGTQLVAIPSGSQVLVGWWATVGMEAERVDLVFRATGGDFTDASLPILGTLEGGGLPVYRYEATETVGTAGSLSEAGVRNEVIGLPLFTGIPIDQGELVVRIAPSLAAGMADGLDYLEHYPYECVEQTVSRFLPNLITTRALKAAGVSDPGLEAGLAEQVTVALQRLYNGQHADGGWGWWSEYKSDPLVSAYVVLGLLEAQRSGYTVSGDVLERGLGFLKGSLQPVRSLEAESLLNRQAFLLYVLARAGQPDPSRTVQLYEVRQGLGLYALGFLGQALHMIQPDDTRLQAIIADFTSRAALSASGAHWEEQGERDAWNWNTDLRTTAILLDTLVHIDPQNALNENAVRWLMANRSQGHWGSTQDTAWTLIALTDWAVIRSEFNADYGYEVRLNDVVLAGGPIHRENLRQQQEVRIDASTLLQEELNRLTLARSDGPGSLYYTAHLSLVLPVDEIEALSRGITLSRNYFRLGERSQGSESISESTRGEMFLARLTIVAPHDLHYVVVEDPLPAGLEAVDRSLKTSQQFPLEGTVQPGIDDVWWGPHDPWGLNSWGWWFFDHVELRDEKLVLSASYLPAGTYEYTYLVRALIPGKYRVIPPTAYEFYFPEVYGRGEGRLFVVNGEQ